MGPLLFNADLCDLFVTTGRYDIANYADDNTPYVSGRNIKEVVASLEEVSEVIFQWFRDNQFQGNANKYHVLLSTDKQVQVNIGTAQIEDTQNEKLPGIIIDSKLNFYKHIQQICSRASAKLKALARIAPFMNITERKMLMNVFFNAQFSYCPLTWMFHCRKQNNKINKLHERCLQTVYNNNTSTYEELLKTDNSVSVHFRNVQALTIELYKVVNGFSPDTMKDVFPLSENLCYNTRNKRTFRSRNIRTAHLDLKRYHTLHLKFGS